MDDEDIGQTFAVGDVEYVVTNRLEDLLGVAAAGRAVAGPIGHGDSLELVHADETRSQSGPTAETDGEFLQIQCDALVPESIQEVVYINHQISGHNLS